MRCFRISFTIFLAVLLSLVSVPAFADEIPTVQADDIIYYGVYEEQPVSWIVLDADQTNMGTEGIFLLSEKLLDSGEVAHDESSTLWEGSLSQQWCTDFAAAAFSEAESLLVPPTSKDEDEVYLYALTWRPVSLHDEQVFFLSAIELEQYFGSYSPGVKYTVKRSSMESYWWLRSPHRYHDDYHGIVLQGNLIHDYLPYARWSARPCINLSVQDAVFLLPAEDEGSPGPVAFPLREITQAETPEESQGEPLSWKHLVPLDDHPFRVERVTADENVLHVQYSGADTAENNMLSLLICDAGACPLSCVRLAAPTSADGDLTLNLADYELPEGSRLFLFNEQANGSCLTNYASSLQELIPEEPSEEEVPDEEPGSSASPADEPQEAPASPGRKTIPVPLIGGIAVAVLLLLLLIFWRKPGNKISPAKIILSILVLLLLALLLAFLVYRRTHAGI